MPQNEKAAIDRLLASPGIENLSNTDALENIAQLINFSGDINHGDGTARAFEWCDILGQRALAAPHAALLEYFRANAWNNRQRECHQDKAAVWAWEQPELEKQLYHLRRAVNHPGLDKLDSVARCQVLTNLANQMNTAGRFVEAVEYWDRALTIKRRFGMALGNRGLGLRRYAGALYDEGHKAAFFCFAHETLKSALSSRAYYESAGYKDAKAAFADAKRQIEPVVGKINRIEMDGYKLGRSEAERRYRRWCLKNRLFVNPLNDLGAHSIAGRDAFGLPSFVTPINEPPTLIGFFNQMKQEFVSARWLFYEGLHAQKAHFSDRGVRLYNTLDYPSYGLGIEKVKAAFRVAYSLFDKIGFFLNDYMQLGVKASDVYFRKIWYENYDKRDIRPAFLQSENWPFRGLFWLSKDLFDEELRDVSEPDAQALHEIRNHLEHKYLKVHEMRVARNSNISPDPWTDRLAYSVYRGDIEAKTLRLLKLARASLIYLSLGMQNEEIRRRKAKDDSIVAPMTLDSWDDEWKR